MNKKKKYQKTRKIIKQFKTELKHEKSQKPVFSRTSFLVIVILTVCMAISLLIDQFFVDKVISIRMGAGENLAFLIAYLFSDIGFIIISLILFPTLFMMINNDHRNYVFFLWGSIGISAIFSIILKELIERQRPTGFENIFPLIVENSFSFPSSHMAFAVASIPFIMKLYPKLKIPSFIFIALVGWSRIFLGVHYLSDVLGGTVLGLLVGYTILFFKEEKIDDLTLELKRQLFHIGNGLVVVAVIFLNQDKLSIIRWILVLIIIVGIIISYIQTKIKIPVISWFLDNFDREGRIPGIGAITFFIGIVIPLFLFELKIALASILILSLGDGVATIVGKMKSARHSLPSEGKTIEGTVGGIAAAILGAIMFVSVWKAIIASVAAMFIEAISSKYIKVDDNILIPIIAGLIMTIL